MNTFGDFIEADRDEGTRIRGEVREIVESRRQEEEHAFSVFSHYLGAVLIGGVAGSLTLLVNLQEGDPFLLVFLGSAFFSLAALIYGCLLYWHFQMRSRRYSIVSQAAERFLSNDSTLADMDSAIHQYQGRLLFTAMFWAPMGCIIVAAVLLTVACALMAAQA